MSTIEATCTACGTINRVGEADVPAGAKFVSCSSCKSRVALPPRPASRATPPPIPAIPSPGAQSIGLADLPAPKRSSPLGGAEPSRPAPRSGLAAADLPAPRAARPVPTPTAGTFDLDDLMPGGAAALDADLPAPKASGGTAGRPAVDLSDLPAPRGARPDPIADLPAPRASGHVPKPRPITDLPEVADLPAPSGRAMPPMPSRPAPGPGIADLPAPKARHDIADLPAPAGPRPQQVTDLPTPARKQGIVDLPTPKHAPGTIDLPTPKHAPGTIDLPTPKHAAPGVSDVPAPKGFFDDLPQPARGGAQPPKAPELPAPKGFFDDLPGRVNQNKPEVPAPKGFFDDLPGRPNPNRASNAPEVPAPKGFFDDLPGRPTGGGALPPAPAPDVPAPKGFFDDLPQPSLPSRPSAPAPKPVNTPVELQMDSSAGALDLGIDPNASKFDDLDLSKPSAVVKITDSKPKGIVDPGVPSFKKPMGPPLDQAPALELEEPRPVPVMPGTQKLGPKRKEVKGGKVADPDAARSRARRVRVLALVLLLVTGLGAGGFYFYRRWAAKREVEETINQQLAKAKTALAGSDLAHWDRASGAAKLVLEADPKHPEALAIFAEANFASAIALGINGNAKTVAARKRLADAVAGSIADAQMKRGQALNAILTPGDANRAVELLDPMLKADPKNTVLNLYMGWALAARDDHAGAIKAFDVVATDGKESIKLHGLYGRGQSKLASGDLAGARADFKAILAIDKEHIAAQVGTAATRTVAEAQDQEKELEAIIALPQFANGDPRAVIRAWNLAAEAAKRGNRFDAARERYRKALAVYAEDVGTLAGFADLELRDGKLDAAAEHINKALAIAKDDVRAQVAQSELSILRGDLPDAKARLKNLLERNPPPPKGDLAKVRMAAGKLSEAEKDDASAAAHYGEAAQLAGDSDLAPTLAAVAKYGALADKETDSSKADELRAKADKLLENIRATAEKDVQLALTLGMAYLRTNDAAKAEPWLRKYVDARPDEAEGQYQLAKALAKLDRADDAINRLTKAQTLAPKRTEIGIELALTYERMNRDDDANGVYQKLLSDNADAGVELRARAGRFFARRGEIDKAAEQGDAILKVAPTHITGMYLKSEGLIKSAQYDEARQLLGKVTTTEREAVYFDALGRANEGKRAQSGEQKYEDQAITAYNAAIGIDEKLFNPHAGLGRLYVLRKEHAKAVTPLRKANELDPRNAEVAFNMGVAFMEQRVSNPDQAKNAITWLKAANNLKDTAEGHYRLGTLYFEVPGGGMGKESAAEYSRATHMVHEDEKKLGPKAVPAWLEDALYMEGNAYMRINNLSAAKNAWERFLTRAQPGVRKKEVERALATSLNGVR